MDCGYFNKKKPSVSTSPHLRFFLLQTPMDRKPPRSRALHEYGFQRAYKACVPCSRRKVKCQASEGEKCVRCVKKRIDCIFTSKKPWSRAPKDGQGSRGGHPICETEIDQRSQPSPRGRIGTKDDHLPTSMLQKVVSNNKDAMNILFEAALREDSQQTTAVPTPTLGPWRLTTTDAVQIWGACRFVKMGWFSAHEAMTLVDLFFENLNPLSPILTDFFASHKNHFYLVTQEPLLCCTILMLSSRYHTLRGVGGCSRAFFIHHRLWQHCQHLLLRLTLGQEKLSKARTRNIGSIEALLLMSEWHPRSLQFPPDTDGWDSDFIMTHLDARDPPTSDEEIPVSARWREDVVEPTKRFERMSWMVLSSALALAHELGAFDPNTRFPKPDGLTGIDAEMYLEHLDLRRQRLPSLLFVYINVLASRIGCTSPMPSNADISVPISLQMSRQRGSREWVSCMNSWINITKMTNSTMTELHPLINAQTAFDTTEQSLSIVEEKQTLIAIWCQENMNSTASGTAFTDILFIEYEYLRVLVSSIGMQLVVQRVLTRDNPHSETTIDHSFIERTRRLGMTGREYGFIEEVIEGSCQILEKVASLGKTGALHYLPMRLLFRTISSSIFLMKALALGVRHSKLQEALQILDRAIAAMQENQQDDANLQSHYAALLHTQAARLRRSLESSNPSPVQPRARPHNGSHSNTTPFSASHHVTPGQGDVASGLDLEGLSNFDLNDWLSLPFDPSMAPFAPYEGDLGPRLDGVDLDLDFIWQLPP